MKRLRKVLLWVVGITAALLVAGWFGLKAYLNSSHVRQQAATQLSEMVGLPVEVDSLSVGTSSTSATFHIPDQSASEPVDLLKVGSLETDVTLLQLISGEAAPTTVTAKGLEVLLRLDAEGKVLSALPKLKAGSGGGKTLPAVQIVGGRFRIQQPGHPEFDLAGITAQLRREGESYSLTGDVNDPKWGKWKVSGKLTADPGDGQIQLQSDQAQLQDQLLRSIPYVPGKVWDEVAPSGTTQATVTLSYRPGSALMYAVDLHPQKATLTIAAISATLTQVEGQVKVAGGKVTIHDARGSLASGAVTVEGAYTFDQPTAVFASKVTARAVDIQQLPAAWGLPKQITGKLRGDADLEIHVPPAGHVDTRGNGRGDIEDAKFAGLPATIKLKLSGGNGRYQFATEP